MQKLKSCERHKPKENVELKKFTRCLKHIVYQCNLSPVTDINYPLGIKGYYDKNVKYWDIFFTADQIIDCLTFRIDQAEREKCTEIDNVKNFMACTQAESSYLILNKKSKI